MDKEYSYYNDFNDPPMVLKTDIFDEMVCENIFMYYDEPILFGCLSGERKFIFMVTARYPNPSEWLVVEVSESRYNALLNNELCMLRAYKNPESGVIYMAREDVKKDIILFNEMSPDEVPEDNFPGIKLYLTYDPETEEEDTES